MIRLAIASSVMILSGCSAIFQQSYSPDLSVSYDKTEAGYRFSIVSHANQDILVEYPFSSIVLIHAVDADGNPTEDVTNIRLPASHCVYYPLESVPRGTKCLTPDQVLSVSIPISEVRLHEIETRGRIEHMKVIIECCPISATKGVRKLKDWYKKFDSISVEAIPYVSGQSM